MLNERQCMRIITGMPSQLHVVTARCIFSLRLLLDNYSDQLRIELTIKKIHSSNSVCLVREAAVCCCTYRCGLPQESQAH